MPKKPGTGLLIREGGCAVNSEPTCDREKSVCFTGHRIISRKDSADLMPKLYSTVTRLAADGYDTFICGGAVGFDTDAAECVLGLKERGADLRLILALPCRDQTVKWNDTESVKRYKKILGSADGVVYAEDFYTSDCMHRRNRWMADNSSVCVAYCKHTRGGSVYTVKYALKNGLQVINLADECDTDQCRIEECDM